MAAYPEDEPTTAPLRLRRPLHPAWVPRPFGLVNIGSCCYFNAIMQAFLSAPAAVSAVLGNSALMSTTRTGRALYAFVSSAMSAGSAGTSRTPETSTLLSALKSDLKIRRPRTPFANGQESASEGLVLLLEMLEPPERDSMESDSAESSSAAVPLCLTNPVAEVFYHRTRSSVFCGRCRREVSSLADAGVALQMFHLEGYGRALDGPGEFEATVRRTFDTIEGYKCPDCGRVDEPSLRYTALRLAPEVLVLAFNSYGALSGQTNSTRWLPEAFGLSRGDAEPLCYRLVASVDHAGSLGGGHYWTRGLRQSKDGALTPCRLNDSSVSPAGTRLGGICPNTYLAFYHHFKTKKSTSAEESTPTGGSN